MGIIKEVKNRKIESVVSEGIDFSIFRKKTTSKTPSGLILSYAKEFKKDNNLQIAILFQEVYRKIKDMEMSEKVKIDSWKGKSGIKLIEKPDKFICITYKKADKWETPKEIKKEIYKEDLNKLIIILNSIDEKDKIPTKELAERFYKKDWQSWVYGHRQAHINLF